MTDDDRIIIEGSGGVDPEDSSVPQLGDGGLAYSCLHIQETYEEGHHLVITLVCDVLYDDARSHKLHPDCNQPTPYL